MRLEVLLGTAYVENEAVGPMLGSNAQVVLKPVTIYTPAQQLETGTGKMGGWGLEPTLPGLQCS